LRPVTIISLALILVVPKARAQSPDTSGVDKTFLTKRDLAISGVALGATLALTPFDPAIARASQESQFQTSGLHNAALEISHVNETTLTIAGIATYGVARLAHAPLVTDVALHATESVVLASVVSQLIRGPLGRARPYVTHDSNQFKFTAFHGFLGDSTFDYRSFPSIHTSSSMAVATVVVMETNLRSPDAVKFVAPVLYAAALLPGLARIQLDQHWASDVLAGGFMGVFTAYKVVSYSHSHPNNWFDRHLLDVSVSPGANGRLLVGYSPAI
jgi:membrane-associated phospholipid phosphatase